MMSYSVLPTFDECDELVPTFVWCDQHVSTTGGCGLTVSIFRLEVSIFRLESVMSYHLLLECGMINYAS